MKSSTKNNIRNIVCILRIFSQLLILCGFHITLPNPAYLSVPSLLPFPSPPPPKKKTEFKRKAKNNSPKNTRQNLKENPTPPPPKKGRILSWKLS